MEQARIEWRAGEKQFSYRESRYATSCYFYIIHIKVAAWFVYSLEKSFA